MKSRMCKSYVVIEIILTLASFNNHWRDCKQNREAQFASQ